MQDASRPRVALTMGDVAGIGPEVLAKAWTDPALRSLARPLVVGSVPVMERALSLVKSPARAVPAAHPSEIEPSETIVPCLDPGGEDVSNVRPGRIDARAGRASALYLEAAIDLALSARVDAITTLPLNKESLRGGGIHHPGHTEILAERCGATSHAMMLYVGPEVVRSPGGLGVVHATLHMPLRDVFSLLSVERIHSTIRLARDAMSPLTSGPPRVAVAGLNPHAGEHGLFGDEESLVIAPAVERARAEGLDAHGPVAADTLFQRAVSGEFDAVVAMYHDQGHVALKTLAFDRAVNVTLGLPIVRTSVAHGTAFDIAWQGRADTSSLIEAVRVAARLVQGRRAFGTL